MANIEEKVEQLLQPTIEELGYSLYDVQYSKEGKDYYLRIFIDKPEGISLNDCETVNNAINDLLDQANYIKEAYFLEVSSPGVERILRKDKHLEAALGQTIRICYFKPVEGKKEQEGILKSYTQQTLTLEGQTPVIIDRKNISLIKTVFDWEK